MSIVVVGDLLLDHDLSGEATRLSPDAPVPVVEIGQSNYRAGGAGLVARMLAADGHDVVLVSVLSNDGAAHRLRAALAGITLACGPSGAPTPVKTRVRASGQAVVRFDEGCGPPPVPQASAQMLAAIARADVVIVADYGRRLAENPEVRRALEAKAATCPVVWDPHPAGAVPVRGLAAVTPNHSEALKFAAAAGGSEGAGRGNQEASLAAAVLGAAWGCHVVVTLGGAGALLHAEPGSPRHIPAPEISTSDPCGAGDRFVGALAVALARGAALPEAVHDAVHFAAAFLADGGVAALHRHPLPPRPAADPGTGTRGHRRDGVDAGEAGEAGEHAQDALRLVESVRAAGGTVVATGGCFDLIHAGHSRTLQAARALGDCLIVLLNSDESVSRLKGSGRPIIAAEDRAELLLAMGCVDGVLLFSEDTPLRLLETVRPDIWVKGGDYDADRLPESGLIASWGGRSTTVPYLVARSTTSLAAALAKVG